MRGHLVFIALLSATTFTLGTGCGDGGTSSSTGGQSSTTSSSGGGGSSSGGTGGTGTGGTATGGTGGTGTGGTAAGGTGGTGTGGTSAGGSGGGTTTGTGGGLAGEHLLISEIALGPEPAEFIEIWNPTAADVSLADYYLSDNSTYAALASGGPWAPITNNVGTDFLARFPANAMLPAGAVRVIATDPGYEMTYAACPDFFLGTAPLPCGGSEVPAMLMTEPGSVTDMSNLSNTREMVMLFTWSGDVAQPLKDVDYVTWGATFENGTRADKTGVVGYLPDTAAALQTAAEAPVPTQSIERCAIEPGEKTSGGNGLLGHDETSENLAASFVPTATPSPGKKSSCL